jgi:hypothetical protein
MDNDARRRMRSGEGQGVFRKGSSLLKKSLSDRSGVQNKTKTPKNPGQNTTKLEFSTSERGQKMTQRSFSTRWVVFETRRARAATPEVLGLSKKEDMDETLKRTRSDAEG